MKPQSVFGTGDRPTISRRSLLTASGAAVGSFTLTACWGGETSSQPRPAPGKAGAAAQREIIIAQADLPPTLFQNMEYQTFGYTIYDSILEYLCKPDPSDPNGGPKPQLAESWNAIGEKQWEFKLRQGVKFHNGEDWNAEAAKANLDLIFKIEPPSPVLFRIQPFESCVVKDEFTLLVNTKEPWAMAPIGLSEVQFGAPAALADTGPQEFAQAPIGTGPFKFAEWKKGESITVEANPDYWGEKPLVERITFRGIPDPATRAAALRSGEVHMVDRVEIEDIEGLESEGFIIADTPVARSTLLSPYIPSAERDGHPTADPKVRLAMNHAIDRQGIIDSVLGGYGQLMGGQVVGREAFGWNPELEDYEYNPELARELLAEAGYPDGVDLGPIYAGEPSEALKQREFMEVVLSQFAEVGIRAELEVLEFSTFLRRALQDYDLDYWQVGGWQYFPVMDAAFALMWYDSDAFLQMDMGNPAYDEVFRASNRELDPDKRKALLQECSRMVHEEAGAVVLWQGHRLYAHVDGLDGFMPTPDERIRLTTLQLQA